MKTDCTLLLLDDEPLILMDLELAAEERGCNSLAATTSEQALVYIAEHGSRISAAVLDVSLQRGQTCVPVARELERRGIAYILHSGDLDRANETVREFDAQLVAKPACSDHVIDAALRCAFGVDGPEGRLAAE